MKYINPPSSFRFCKNDRIPVHRINRILKPLLLFLSALLFCVNVFADDPGITKVRLIQESDTTYTLEIDIAQALLGTIKSPVLPERFQISNPDVSNNSGWITLKARISTTQDGFNPDDEILLPWARNAVDITAQWKDGNTYKGFFTRTLNGIHIPLKEIMYVEKTGVDIFKEYFTSGLSHFTFKFVHILLILALALSFRSGIGFRFLLSLSLGQMLSMVFMEIGLTGFDLLFADLLIVLLVLVIAYVNFLEDRFKYLEAYMFFIGLFHGMAFANELYSTDLLILQRIKALFAFNMAMDLGHYTVFAVVLLIRYLSRKIELKTVYVSTATGAMAVFLTLLIFNENVITDKTEILNFQKSGTKSFYKNVNNNMASSQQNAVRGKGLMTTPVMLFMSVEPFEVRKEILLQASAANHFLGFNSTEENLIPVDKQETIKQELARRLLEQDTTFINNQTVAPAEIAVNFVTLGRGGVAIKEKPVVEDLNESILGISLIYDIQLFPDSVSFNWNLFQDSEEYVEASVVDPHGAFTTFLNKDQNNLAWESRIKGYQVPTLEAIEVQKDPKAYISIFVWIVLLFFVAIQLLLFPKPLKKILSPQLGVIFIISLLIYPFIRPSVNLPFVPQGKPSIEKGNIILSDLLTNVYRAFDRRNENDVYDKLALSVSDDQLTEIFIQNRQSMLLENRGGARANVDEVNIEDVYKIERDRNGGYKADTKWTVRGSVNHYGHTHYRQNQYRALVTFAIENNYWKINKIEILDTRRLY